jgi:tetratricopeptide (TPR) repeat protein
MNWDEIKSNIDTLDEAAFKRLLYSDRMIDCGFDLLMKSANYLRIKKKINESLNLLDMTFEKCDSVKNLIRLLYLRGDVYMDDKRYNESITCYTLIIDLQPQDIAYNNRGVAYWELNKHQQARSDFEAAISINPTNKTALYGAGMMCLLTDDFLKAKKYFNKALEIDPAYFDAKEGLSKVKQQQP